MVARDGETEGIPGSAAATGSVAQSQVTPPVKTSELRLFAALPKRRPEADVTQGWSALRFLSYMSAP
jgi:hypothetical protein